MIGICITAGVFAIGLALSMAWRIRRDCDETPREPAPRPGVWSGRDLVAASEAAPCPVEYVTDEVDPEIAARRAQRGGQWN